MIRHWQVAPDQEMQTHEGPVGVVSYEALASAVIDGVTMVHRAGGNLSLVVSRRPTGFPGEMVTVEAVVTWQDRTNAKAQLEPALNIGSGQEHVDETPIDQGASGDPSRGDGDSGVKAPPPVEDLEVDEESVPEHLRV